ncbi:hypothetical protein AAF712_016073 [Marasmius tenuissimus]|uniref:Uncharacterized protein n=1 Tax=Marasmius tenuissimus TaxID=585030 RepID=A0ABR2Z959_9AGAR
MPFISRKKSAEDHTYRASGRTRSKRRLSEPEGQQEMDQTPGSSNPRPSITQRLRKKFKLSRMQTPSPEPEPEEMDIGAYNTILRSSEPPPEVEADTDGSEARESVDVDIDMEITPTSDGWKSLLSYNSEQQCTSFPSF